jgi:hypothetical protein
LDTTQKQPGSERGMIGGGMGCNLNDALVTNTPGIVIAPETSAAPVAW